MKWYVNDPLGYATNLRSFAGANVTLINNSAVDIYYDVEGVAGTINTTAPGVIPLGTKIANSGGSVQFNEFPREVWVRAISQTQLDVQSNAPAVNDRGVKQQVLPGDMRGGNNVFKPAPKIRSINIFGATVLK